MKSLPKPVPPLVVTTVSDDRGAETVYQGVPVGELLEEGKGVEDVVWLLWTGKLPDKKEKELVRQIVVLTADHGPAVAGAYTTILGESAGLEMPQAVAAGVSMIGPRFGGASGAAARQFQKAVTEDETVELFQKRLKAEGVHYLPGFGHKVLSKSRPDKRIGKLADFAKKNLKKTPHLDFALAVEEELLKKNEKLILNIDGTIGATLLDFGFPIEGIDGFFILARTIGLVAHYIDQKKRGTALIRLPEELVFYKS